MTTNGLILIGAIFAVVAMVVFVFSLVKAPEAAEDEDGFHYRKAPKSVRNQTYSVRSAAPRRAQVPKSFKTHLPSTASAVPWDF